MSSTILKEADRVMTICNACRYCEGFCAVFPAMELRRTFSEQDLKYLANLCHNCRDCYYACQYAPPHTFALNVPRTMAELRLETYREYSWPRAMKGFFQNNGLLVALITALSVAVVLLLTLLFQGHDVFFSTHTGEGAFYRVIPYAAMVVPFSAVAALVLVSLWKGLLNQWREIGGTPEELRRWPAHLQALGDVLRLKYLDGGGHGCNYPDDRFSMIRRNFHHAVFYGFMLCLASTTIAFIYDHLLHRSAPYPFWSWPVVLGTVGGLALLVGTGGLLYLKRKMDREPAAPETLGMDVVFVALLFLTSLTGLLLLFCGPRRSWGVCSPCTSGSCWGCLSPCPMASSSTAIYRYTALVKNAIEQARDKE